MYAAEEVRLAALLHDVGKPYCYEATGKFLNHENVGADIADEICKRLKVSNSLRERTVKLVRLHMYDLDCRAKEGKVRKFIVQNIDVLDELLELKQADYSACKDNLSIAPCVEKWKKVYQNMRDEGAPFTIKQLKVNGDDLLSVGIPPVKVGKTLNVLLLQCACTPPLNEKNKLIKLAKSFSEQLK
jgi:CRISPR/Cas system-associated endonuclease Cas3-HD